MQCIASWDAVAKKSSGCILGIFPRVVYHFINFIYENVYFFHTAHYLLLFRQDQQYSVQSFGHSFCQLLPQGKKNKTKKPEGKDYKTMAEIGSSSTVFPCTVRKIVKEGARGHKITSFVTTSCLDALQGTS